MDINDAIDEVALSEQKKELLALLLEEEGVEVPQEQTIPPRKKVGDRPLSFAQQRLWFLDHFEDAKLAYNRPANLRFTGALNVDTLRRSLDEIADPEAFDGFPFAIPAPTGVNMPDREGVP